MENYTNNQKPNRHRPGTLLWPLLLISFGLMLLLNNLDLLNKSVWEILFNLWPIIFIALGLDGLLRKKEIFGPVFWISLGGVFLLSNFGIIGWNTWNSLIHLWPLLLITAGLEILFGKRSVWISLIVTIFLLGIIIVALWPTKSLALSVSDMETSINEPIGTADNADITIRMAIGDLRLFSLVHNNILISGDLSTEEANVRYRTNKIDNSIEYSLEQTNPIMDPINNTWPWSLGLTSQIPIELETSLGVGFIDLKLNGLILEGLTIAQGIGEIEVIIPKTIYNTKIDQAAGQMVLNIPKDSPIRLKINRGVSSISLPSSFEKHNEYYYSPEAHGNVKFMQIVINQALGNIIVRYK